MDCVNWHLLVYRPLLEDDYPFVEQPSEDFFCPVTFGLLLQSHQTQCCGKIISQEAVMRIQRKGGVCPLCKASGWSTVEDKHFQRQVRALRVFCRHKDKGCDWQGELANLQQHVLSCEHCPMVWYRLHNHLKFRLTQP